MATLGSITEASKEADTKALEKSELLQSPYIYYPVQFDRFSIETFIDLGSKINTIKPSFLRKLGFHICIINVSIKKIDGSRLKTYKMVIALFFPGR